MATKYEIENRNARQDAVTLAVQEKITKPWWGTMTELVEFLAVQLPFPHVLTPRTLSATLAKLEDGGWIDHTVRHWHTGKARMVALIPPGWRWDNEHRQWVVNGSPVPTQEPSQTVPQ